MNIGILSQNKEKNITGINRVTMGILTELLKQDNDNRYIFLGRTEWLQLPMESLPIVMSTDKTLSLNYLQMSHPMDIIHSHYRPFHVASHMSCGKILTIHDLIPLLYPQWYGSQYDYFDIAIRQCAKEMDVVIAVSECTKRDIIKYYNIPEDKIKVVYNGLFPTKFFDRYETGEAVAGLEGEKFLLTVSGVGPHKNQRRLVEAFLHFKRHNPWSGIKLVLTGPVRRYDVVRDILQEHGGLEKDIVFTGFVTDKQLIWLYQNAEAFLYTSLYEGFGLPILEAMSVGKAVICSNTSSMPEVGGEAVEYCNPQDVESISESIGRVVLNPIYRQELERRAVEQASRFSYEKAAREMMEIYQLFPE